LVKTISQVDEVDTSMLRSLSGVDLFSILRTQKISVLQILNVVIDLSVSPLVARILKLAAPIELQDLARTHLLLATLKQGPMSSFEHIVL
jgi:hypothetical protein